MDFLWHSYLYVILWSTHRSPLLPLRPPSTAEEEPHFTNSSVCCLKGHDHRQICHTYQNPWVTNRFSPRQAQPKVNCKLEIFVQVPKSLLLHRLIMGPWLPPNVCPSALSTNNDPACRGWWYTPLIPPLRCYRQEDFCEQPNLQNKFQDS